MPRASDSMALANALRGMGVAPDALTPTAKQAAEGMGLRGMLGKQEEIERAMAKLLRPKKEK